jgi:hypothetical protein
MNNRRSNKNDDRNFLRSKKEEWNPDEGLSTQYYPFITPDLPKEFMDECMEIVEKLDKRTNKIDVVNWNERAEMDKVTKRSGKYLSIDEDDDKKYSDTAPTNEEREARGKPPAPKIKVTKKEQNLMDYLGGVMDALGDE